MEAYQRQQFDFLLLTAAERFAERLVQRCGGAGPARARLRADPQGEGVWLDQFAQAIFRDFLLNNPAGACFVLQALACRPAPAPTAGATIEALLGQPSGADHAENRDGPPPADSFRWPHAIAGDAQTLYVADAGNHRVLGWSPAPERDRPADLVLGQPNLLSASEMPHAPPGPSKLRFPYAVAADGGRLVVADTADNRVLIWQALPRAGAFAPADAVVGQPDFAGNGENRWRAVERDTLCWPYGVHLHRGRLAIADSGNNRVMIWAIPQP